MTPQRAWRTTDVPPEYWEQAHLVGSIPFKAAASDPRASYCMYVPRQHYRHTAPKLPLIVNVHGNERHAERSRDCLLGLADRVGAAVLAPLFPNGIDDPNDTHNYKRLSNRGIRYDHILIDMLSEVGQRWPGIENGQILLVGFSGGGQFALKFFYLHPDRLMAVSIGAPGVVTRLDDTLKWPRGTKDMETLVGEAARVADLDALRGVQGVQLVVGSLDVQDVIDPGFYSWMLSKQDSASEPDRGSRADNAAAILSLPTRKAALEGLHEDLKARGICSELQIVDSVAHDAAGVLEQVTSFLARFLQR